MSLLFFDSFDQYDVGADLISEGPWTNGSAGLHSSITPFSYGKSVQQASGHGMAVTLTDQSTKTIYIGFNYRVSNNASAPDTNDIFALFEDNANGVVPTVEQLAVRWDNGFIKVYRGDFVTLLGTGTVKIPRGTWFYLEFKILIHGSTGTFENKISGVTDLSLTSQNTQAAASDSVLSFNTEQSNVYTSYLDDFYIGNSDGSAPHNTYLGKVRSQILFPDGDNSVVWSRNTGSTNYQQIDETNPDGDTTYVYSATPSDKDLYDMGVMNTDVSSVLAVKTRAIAEKSDASAKSYKIGIKHSTNEQLSSARTLTESYTYEEDIYITSDGSSTAWTETTVNAALLVIEDQ